MPSTVRSERPVVDAASEWSDDDFLDFVERDVDCGHLVVSGDSWPAMACAFSMVPPFSTQAVIPVARKVWQQPARHLAGAEQVKVP